VEQSKKTDRLAGHLVLNLSAWVEKLKFTMQNSMVSRILKIKSKQQNVSSKEESDEKTPLLPKNRGSVR
jgi:hypothetical protein